MTEQLFFETIGDGIPLILLHGYPLDHSIWQEVAAGLKNEARIIMPDLRGQGKSPAPAGTYLMVDLAGDILQILDKLNIEKTIIAGHSMGGYVALALAKIHPERLSGLALVASHAYADSAEKKQARLDSIERIKREGVQPILAPIAEKLSKDPSVVDRCRALAASASAQGIIGTLAGLAAREDMADVFFGLEIPTMMISGMEDQINPSSVNREMARGLKSSWLVEIEGAGHMPMLEKPEQVIQAFKSFILTIKEKA
ncbi:MAG: alpha/beta fold hydrolase [Anaerolineae bacterium]|nr:alpha/beta fold hydrolase [Anaerolineae bacterium]